MKRFQEHLVSVAASMEWNHESVSLCGVSVLQL